MITIVGRYEYANRQKARVTSIVFLVIFLFLLIFPLLKYPDPPPGQEGVLVNLGIPDVGQGEENAPESQAEEAAPPEPEETQEEQVEEVEPEPVESKPEPEPVKEVVKTEDPNAIALKKKKEEERKKKREDEMKKKKQEEDRKRKLEEIRRKEAEEAKKKADYEKKKKQFGDLFGNGEGKGKTGKPGNQGDPGGDPNASNLEGISTGKGRVGGGLGERGVRKAPTVTDNSQKTGTVVIKLCVNANGDVIGSPEFTQRGSTTTDKTLIDKAKRNAKNWKFATSREPNQCGTIKYEFKVK